MQVMLRIIARNFLMLIIISQLANPALFSHVSGVKETARVEQKKEQKKTDVKKVATTAQEKTEKLTLVVLIHGTILPILSFGCLIKALNAYMKKKKRNHRDFYQCFLDELRFKSFYACQPIGELGLHPVSYDKELGNGQKTALITSLFYERINDLLPADSHHSHVFCTFGWSGRLSGPERRYWADVLYLQLQKKINEVKKKLKKNQELEVVLMAHSHGGNVALNLALAEEKFKGHLVVDKLVLLGTPVQSETEHMIYSPIFKSIFNFYSKGDRIQQIDIFSTEDSWSRRTFKRTSLLSARMVQIAVEVAGTHPRHNELWFFGAQSNWVYRKRGYPLYPLPFSVFVPFVVNYLNKYMKKAKNVTVRVEPVASSFTLSFAKQKRRRLKYKKSGFAVSLDDIMADFSDGSMSETLRSAFRFVGFRF